MDEKDRMKLFEQALAKNQQEQADKETKRKGGGSFDFEKIEWVGLDDEKDAVIRILGMPLELRNSPYDSKIVYTSKIVNDKGKHCHITWRADDENKLDESWLLHKLYSTVMERKWVKYADDHKNEKGYNGEYSDINKGRTSYERIKANSKEKEKYPQKFYPKTRIAVNVIDRADDWCAKNNHTKALSSKHTFWQNDSQTGVPIYFTDTGIPKMLYDKIMTDVISYRIKEKKTWEDFDIVIRKNSKVINDAYKVKDIFEEKVSDYAKKIGNANPMTPVELKYEKYDFDKLFKVSTYAKIKTHLTGLFKQVDADFGTTYYEELESLIRKEDNEKTKETVATNDPVITQQIVQQEKPVVTIPDNVVIAQTEGEQPVRRVQVNSISIEEQCKQNFPKWDNLSANEKKNMILSISNFDGGVPVYVNPKETIPCKLKGDCKYPGTTVDVSFPDIVFICPVCGTVDKG